MKLVSVIGVSTMPRHPIKPVTLWDYRGVAFGPYSIRKLVDRGQEGERLSVNIRAWMENSLFRDRTSFRLENCERNFSFPSLLIYLIFFILSFVLSVCGIKRWQNKIFSKGRNTMRYQMRIVAYEKTFRGEKLIRDGWWLSPQVW